MIISISDDCVCCGACEAISPDVFSVDSTARINTKNIELHKEECIDAALICPVNAIWIDDIY